MDVDSQQRMQRELASGERLLWSGRPRQGLRLRAGDALMIPFSLLWGGFAIFWETMALRTGPLFFALFGIPFVMIGLYMIVGRFFADSYQRGRTYYGLTDQRALILTAKGVKSLSLRALADVSLRERGDRSGTISFGVGDPRYAFFAGSGWPGMGHHLPPSFDRIEEARQVYTQVRDAQQAFQRIGA